MLAHQIDVISFARLKDADSQAFDLLKKRGFRPASLSECRERMVKVRTQMSENLKHGFGYNVIGHRLEAKADGRGSGVEASSEHSCKSGDEANNAQDEAPCVKRKRRMHPRDKRV